MTATTLGSLAERRSFRLALPTGIALTAAVLVGALAGRNAMLALALSGVLLVLVTALLKPELATFVALAVLYSNAAAVGVRFHGLPFIAGSVIPLLFLVPIGYDLLIRRAPIVSSRVLPVVVALLVVHIVATLTARDPVLATEELVRFVLEGLLIVVLITQAVRTPESLRLAVWTLVLVGGLLASLSVFQQVTSTFANQYLGFAQTGTGDVLVSSTISGDQLQLRLEGPIGERNRYAQILIVLVPLAIFRLRAERSRLLRGLALGCTIMILFATALTFSRGAAVALAVVFVAMALFRYISRRQIAALVSAVVLVLILVPGYAGRLATLQALPAAAEGATRETSVGLRANSAQAGAAMFMDHPLLGVGPGLYATYYRQYAEGAAGIVGTVDFEAHNFYVEVASEMGLVGVLAYAALFVVLLSSLLAVRRRWLHERPDVADMAAGFLFALLAWMGSAFFLHLSYHRYFWILVALSAAAAAILRERDATVVELEAGRIAPGDGRMPLINGDPALNPEVHPRPSRP